MKFNSYLGRGINDYLYAKQNMMNEHIRDYNWPAVICAQAVEKILKAVIETQFAEDSSCIGMLKTHNLRTVVNKILIKYPECKISSKDCKWLGDFYYDARYPGDDFVEVSREDAIEALRIVEATLKEVECILINTEAQELFDYYKQEVNKINRIS